MPVRSGYMPVKKALRPEVQLCIGDVVHEHRALVADAVDVGRFADHQAAVVDARLHPADVVAHDEEDVGLLLAVCAAAGVLAGPDSDINIVAPSKRGAGSLVPTRRLAWRDRHTKAACRAICNQHGVLSLFMMHQRLLA